MMINDRKSHENNRTDCELKDDIMAQIISLKSSEKVVEFKKLKKIECALLWRQFPFYLISIIDDFCQ